MRVAFSERVIAIDAGMHFSIALAESGSVYAWGWNACGQLGLVDRDDRSAPTRVPVISGVRTVAAGQAHAVALTATSLIGWGNNTAGQLGGKESRPTTAVSMLNVKTNLSRGHHA